MNSSSFEHKYFNSISTAFLTDHYELTMLNATIADGTAWRKTNFELFGRRLPNTRRYGVVSGIHKGLEAVKNFKFTGEQLDYLHKNKIVDSTTIDFLADFKFSGDIFGYAEGECYFNSSPILQVSGNFAECVLLETVLLSIINYSSAVAGAASRMITAAEGRPCIEMGSRRMNEMAAVEAARSAALVGFAATSNLQAGLRYGIKTTGTAAHAFTLLHKDEEAAFASQIETMGTDTALLVDTYDIENGIKTAIKVANSYGGNLRAIRLDSGDLRNNVRFSRKLLDSLGAKDTQIIVTSDLDEYAIASLQSTPVDAYGVGTHLVTGSKVPTAALVYKLTCVQDDSGNMQKVEKKSENKSSVGGYKTAVRLTNANSVDCCELVLNSKNDIHRADISTLVKSVPSTSNTVKDIKEKILAKNYRNLIVDYVTDGIFEFEGLSQEQKLQMGIEHHRMAISTLPEQARKLSDGDVAVDTVICDVDQEF